MSTIEYKEALLGYQSYGSLVKGEDLKIAEVYLQKYWLSIAQY